MSEKVATVKAAKEPPEEILADKIEAGGITIRQDIGLRELAQTFIASKIFKDMDSASKAVVKIMAGAEMGIGPVASMKGFHIFDGQIEMASSLMAALILRSGTRKYRITQIDDEACVLDWFERDHIAAEWESCSAPSSMTHKEAEKANLLKKNNWVNWKQDMLFSRALSRGFRRYCAHFGSGPVYVEGELSDAGLVDTGVSPTDDLNAKLQGEAVEVEAEVIEPSQADATEVATADPAPVNDGPDETPPETPIEETGVPEASQEGYEAVIQDAKTLTVDQLADGIRHLAEKLGRAKIKGKAALAKESRETLEQTYARYVLEVNNQDQQGSLL